MSINKTHSNLLFALKCFATVMIVSCHCYTVPETFSQPLQYVSSALSLFGFGGVGIFFLISGYLFAFNKYSFREFCKRKFTSLILPWVFTGTLVWAYIVLRKQGIAGLQPADWLLWLGGVKTYLWYMSVLVILYLLFLLFSKSRLFLILVPLLSVLSYLTYHLTYPYLWSWGGNYLNVFSWLLFFWTGFMVGKKNCLDAILSVSRKYGLLIVPLYIVSLIVLTAFKIPCEYGMPIYLPYMLLTVFAFLSISLLVSSNLLMKRIGMDSFSIYLLHMPLAGIVANLGNRVESVVLLVLRPIIVIFILEILLLWLRKIVAKFSKFGWIDTLIGTRMY